MELSFDSANEATEYQHKHLELKIKSKPICQSNTPLGILLTAHIQQSPSTTITARKNSFTSFWNSFAKTPMHLITTDHLHQWFTCYQKQNQLTNRTMNRIKAHINHFFKWLVNNDICAFNPIDRIKFSENQPPKRKRVILSEEEQEVVLKELQQSSSDILYPIILCYMHTGCRRAELAELRWKQVDFENELVHIDTGKTGKVRSLRMTSEMRLVLAKLNRNSAYVFTNEYGNRFTHSHFDRHLKDYQRTSSISKPWTVHDLRRTFAYHFLRKGGQVYQLQALMGHRNIQVTVDVYGQLGASCV